MGLGEEINLKRIIQKSNTTLLVIKGDWDGAVCNHF